jgi:hypothetical protein
MESNKGSHRAWHADTINSSKDMLLGYHYALRQQAKQLAKEKVEIQKRKDLAIAASNAARRA